ncbi:MAG: hypothetical protein AAF604_09975 [Acidobacteriota bacterium]
MKTRGPQVPRTQAPLPAPAEKARSKRLTLERPADGGEFAALLAALEREPAAPAKTKAPAGAGLPVPEPEADGRDALPSLPGYRTVEAEAIAGSDAIAFGEAEAAMTAELAERLVTATRLVRVGDRVQLDLRLAGGDSGIRGARIVRHGGGRFEIALITETVDQRRAVEARLEGLSAALEQRGLSSAVVSVETRPAGELLSGEAPVAGEQRQKGDGQHGGDAGGGGGGQGGDQGRQGDSRESSR